MLESLNLRWEVKHSDIVE